MGAPFHMNTVVSGLILLPLVLGAVQERRVVAESQQVEAVTAPEPPSNLRGEPRVPFRMELRWDATGRPGTSVVVEGFHKYRGWIRVALINPGHTTYLFKGAHAGRTYRFRVRAFDASGVSDASNEVRLTATAALKPASTVREDDVRPCEAPPEIGARLPSFAEDPHPPEVSAVRRVTLGKHRFVVWISSDCDSVNCDNPVAMWRNGCFRPVGSIIGGYLSLDDGSYLGDDLGGSPVLLASSHASASEAGFSVLQFSGRGFGEIDSWSGCGEFDDKPLRDAAPPFEECQHDDLAP